ncbi:radical SAM protein [Sediminispirochaeta smaragdinae]|uniref:Radical SAM domain protein n=1 Tax=Sediminispirochaeta smaragdinae (strain DSM 11293 / JCM 15392 / SEBR 4228) TaxID=573413 RepID=E1RBM1_SEDSS|nr:radical SAM protein [Sediminispirochaeta smaragdinae]ADK79751.1 Radical SAM domain protein [Sediminispirochaeta smaragdinae DSM 11293]
MATYQNTTQITVRWRNSGEERSVSVDSLYRKSLEFLELYANADLTSEKFLALIGEGGARQRFARLIEACGYEDDPAGFFGALLPELAAGKSGPKRINGIILPYRYLMALLELLIPQKGFVSIGDVDQLVAKTNLMVPEAARTELQKVIETYPVRLSYHTIRQMLLSPDVAYQYMPFVEELDPVGHTNTWIGQFHQGLLEQMYQNRVIFLLNMSCPVYCRFCFRKHKESRNEKNPTVEDVNRAIAHVEKSPSIKEIVLTGGDPFLNRSNMAAAIDGLMGIDHVQSLRLATRSLAYYPELFLGKGEWYLNYLKQKNLELQLHGKRMEIATHFIHPDEVSPESLGIITELVKSGIAVYVQTPFLQHCNDTGPELQKLFRLLRGAGAEMHYIYIPCSPIHGNSVYWSPLSDGIDIAEYLRAHLSDRSVPKICTATPIGKMEWYTSGWAVEQVEGQENFIWIRTPYTPDYFKSFAPMASKLPNIRVNEEGTLDIQYMAKIGKASYFLGSRPLRIKKTTLPLSIPDKLQLPAASALLGSQQIVKGGSAALSRVHETRVELQSDVTEADIDYIRSDTLISDVIIRTSSLLAEELHEISSLIGKIGTIDHVNAVRISLPEVNYAPESISPAMIQHLASCNRLTVSNPLRLEIETWFINANQITEMHSALVRRLNNKGITVYANTPLLGEINDNPDEIYNLTYAYRRAGIEFHHLYVAGHPIQKAWNEKHPIDMYDVVDIASKIRREGSGREGPRYILQTPLGDVYYGLTSSFIHGGGDIRVKLDSYDLPYFKALDSSYTLPKDVFIDDGKPVIPMPGLVSSTNFPV